MNRIFLTGNLTKNPELKHTATGKAVCTFSIAVNRFSGKETDFFTVVAWNNMAENLCKYQMKGSKILVEGELQNRSYELSSGEKRYVTEIIASKIEFISKKITNEPVNIINNNSNVDEYQNIQDGDLPF